MNARFLLPGGELEGIGRFTWETVRRMVDSNPHRTFHLLFDRRPDPRYLRSPNVRAHVLAPPARHPVLWFAWFEIAVAAWLARHRPAVFLSSDGFTTLNTTTPRVTVVHDLTFEHFGHGIPPTHRAYYRAMTPRYVAASERVVTVSEASRRDIITTYAVPAAKVAVVPNAVSAHFRPLAAAERALVRGRMTGGAPFVFLVGPLHPRKNIAGTLRAFDMLRDRIGTDVRLLVAGRLAWQAGEIIDAFTSLRHRDAVHFLGRVPDRELADLYGASAATAYVPFIEGFGLPILEAQACGSPVVTSDCSSMPEVAGGAAIHVDPHRPEHIAHALLTVLTQPRSGEDLRSRGFENARSYSWESSAGRLWSQLSGLVDADPDTVGARGRRRAEGQER